MPRRADVTLDVAKQEVSFFVSMSKTDAEARGAKLKWSCICGHGRIEECTIATAQKWMRCPYHLALDMAVRLHGFDAGDKTCRRVGSADRHFFMGGDKVTPQMVGRMLKNLDAMHRLSEPEDNPPTANWGGHTLRRSGAQEWFRLHMPRETIKMIGRWKSKCIDDCLGAVPLENLGLWSFNGPMQPLINSLQNSTVAELQRTIEELKRVTAEAMEVTKTTLEMLWPQRRMMEGERRQAPTNMYIKSDTGKLHKIRTMLGPKYGWSCKCGFKFGMARDVVTLALTDDELLVQGEPCTKGCFTAEELGQKKRRT